MVIKFTDTPCNKGLTLIKGYGEPTLISGDLIESGHILTHIWKTGIDYLLPKNFTPKNVLLLGLGGGSNAIYVHKKYPNTQITAIEIDPLMVEIANKYFKLNKKIPDIKIIIADALDFINKLSLDHRPSDDLPAGRQVYDLVLVDCFEGKWIPKKLENLDFIQKIKDHSRYTLINRIWYNEHHISTISFMKSLSTRFIYSKVHTSTNTILSLL